MKENTRCPCCRAGIPKTGPRICPECSHVFKGQGWGGIDRHWRTQHENIMPYEQFMGSLCAAHGGFPNEQRVARLCWNTNNWERPSGPTGKSKNRESYEYLYGYGHEEWLFDMAKLVEGYHYAFIQSIGSKGRKTYAGQVFDLSFYSIEDKSRRRYWIGNVRNVEVVDAKESKRVFNIYKKKGWLDEMVQQVKDAGADHKIFKTSSPASFVTIRFKPSDLDLLDIPKEFSKDDPAVTSDYYNYLKYKVADPQLESGKFKFTAGHNPKKKNATISPPPSPKVRSIELVHNQIQEKIFKQLVSTYGKGNVGTEIDAGYGGCVDVAVKLSKSGKYDFYEIKTNIGVRACIRDALSQLLEYAYYSNEESINKLIVVSQNAITDESEVYLKLLRNKFKLPVYYQRFNMDTGKLESEIS